ncbi:hypothetical protein PENSTE_c027G05559 [Penicillium steckii]|uniref:Uncharacterized protein n=1 Tax=Penicillium steckii TaxID=303698 RepID=A0A1V6SPW2_9EURO|nr:hypothetical protein PENSTE_c027G05559 [Penicillium steckii]
MTATATSQTLAVVSLPYVMGSMTVLNECAATTEFPDDPILFTPTQTQPTHTVTDYTSTEMNGNVWLFTAGAEYQNYNNEGAFSVDGPLTQTTGLGEATKEIVHNYITTNDGGTTYLC